MNQEQFSRRIGNIDDKLVQQAERIPHYGRQRRQKWLRRFSAAAAVVALMVCSGAVGAIAFGKENIVEVPVEPETITLADIGLTLILPDEWKGQYGVEMNEDGTGCAVYVKSIHDDSGPWAGEGYLFWIGAASSDGPLTPEELYAWSPTPCLYLFSTADRTYILEKHSDVQYDPNDPEQAALYTAMSQQIQDIVFIVDTQLSERLTSSEWS